jgi:hypothetical protein
MEYRTGQCKRTKQLAIIQEDEYWRTDPTAQPVSTATKITIVCAMVIITTTQQLHSVLKTVEVGADSKFIWDVC